MTQESASGSPKTRAIVRVALVLLFALTGLRMADAARRTSLTYDEPVHIAAALRYWRTGDLRFNRNHPPLMKWIAGAPLALTDAEAEFTAPDQTRVGKQMARKSQWTYADRVVFENRVPPETLIDRARAAMIAFTLAFAVIVFLFARSLFGPVAGLFACALFCLDPSVLAHGPLVKNDVGLAGLVLAAFFALHRYNAAGGLWRLIVSAVVFGLALGTKLSALPVAPLFAALAAWAVWLRTSGRATRRIAVTTALVALCFLASDLALNAAYGFGSLNEFEGGIGLLSQHRGEGHPAFLFAEVSENGWWYYFPVAIALKTPLPVLAAWLVGLALLPRTVRRIGRLNAAIVLAPPVLLAVFAAYSRVNIGIRHVLVVYPFFAVLASSLACEPIAGRWGRRTAGGLAALLAAVSLFAHPAYLSYFNGFGGDAEHKASLLGDSNLDWGQDLPRLADWMHANAVDEIVLGYFGTDHPERFGIDSVKLGSPEADYRIASGAPGWAAVSATIAQGIYETGPLVAPFAGVAPDLYLGDVWRLYRLPLARGADR